MASEKPEYGKDFTGVGGLGPVAFLGHTRSRIMKNLADNVDSKAFIMKHVGMNQFNPSQELLEDSRSDCRRSTSNSQICDNVYFLLYGYEDDHYNKTIVDAALHHFPAGASVRQILHHAYSVRSGRFEKYDQDWNSKGEYDLSKINMPVTVFYTPYDGMAYRDDVYMLMDQLPKVKHQKMYLELESNADFIFARNVRETVYEYLMRFLDE